MDPAAPEAHGQDTWSQRLGQDVVRLVDESRPELALPAGSLPDDG